LNFTVPLREFAISFHSESHSPAYKLLSLKWHPDKNPDNENALKNYMAIREAYERLSGKSKKNHL